MRFIFAVCFSFLCMVDQSDAMLRIANARNAYNTISRTFLCNVPSGFRWFSDNKISYSNATASKTIKPTVDLAFKHIFGKEANQDILIHFLNSILVRNNNPITTLTLSNTEIPQESSSDKLSRLDLVAHTMENEIINVEIQVQNKGNMIDRSLYYASKLISQSLRPSDSYNKLGKFIMINLLGYNHFGDEQKHRIFKLLDLKMHTAATDMLEIHFFELPKYTISSNTNLELWMSFLKDPYNEVFKEKDKLPKEVVHAMNELNDMEHSEKFLSDYAQREKELRDAISSIEETAINLLKLKAITKQQISNVTYLPLEVIEILEKRINNI